MLLVSCALASSFTMPTPDGWKTETIPFPLEFAPELSYEGKEELRFAPGMFDDKAEDYFSYAFVWWVPSDTEIDKKRLELDLVAYFRGLAAAVAKGKEKTPDLSELAAALKPHKNGYRGSVIAYDAFKAMAPVALNVRIRTVPCGDRSMISFVLSPQKASHTVWSKLDDIDKGLACPQ